MLHARAGELARGLAHLDHVAPVSPGQVVWTAGFESGKEAPRRTSRRLSHLVAGTDFRPTLDRAHPLPQLRNDGTAAGQWSMDCTFNEEAPGCHRPR
jgi:hypothetical protein